MELSCGNVAIAVDPEGGRLASVKVEGREILVQRQPKPTRWGSFPMIPWCGRLPFGKLATGDGVVEMPLTSPPHANHGVAHTNRWMQTSDDTQRIELDALWPFGGFATQRFEVGDTYVKVTGEVHAAAEPMPAMLGWHPWFLRDIGVGEQAALAFEANAVYETDDDAIPTGNLVSPPEGPWDACFVGLSGDPVVRWGTELAMTVSSTFDHWVIFTEPAHALCVEPQSGPPNQFNLDPQMIEPGSPLVGSMTFSFD